jgi:hypothetical protein
MPKQSDEQAIEIVRGHITTFEKNTYTKMWRATCTCGWRSGEESRQVVQAAAATHDLWVPVAP